MKYLGLVLLVVLGLACGTIEQLPQAADESPDCIDAGDGDVQCASGNSFTVELKKVKDTVEFSQ